MSENIIFPIEGMSCAACASRIEKVLNRQNGVKASVSFASGKAQVELDPSGASIADVIAAVRKAGYDVSEQSIDLAISGMTCAACAARVEKILNKMPMTHAAVNFATERAHVTFVPGVTETSDIINRIDKAGFSAEQIKDVSHDDAISKRNRLWITERNHFLLTLLLSLPLFYEMVAMFSGFLPGLPRWAQFAFATPVQFYCARHLYQRAWNAVRGGSANMDVLVVLGTGIAYLFSAAVVLFGLDQPVYFEASASIITLVSLGKLMELRARNRMSAGVESLLRLQPSMAHIEVNGTVIDRAVDEVREGDIFVVRPGESIPVDGIVLEGSSDIDESMLTGESIPVFREVGGAIIGGTLNANGVLKARATGVGSTTVLAQIVKMVEQAQGSKAAVQRLADKVSGVFVPVVVGGAILTFLLGWLITGSVTWSLVSAVSVLVIACPCSLGLATPTAIMVGTGRGAHEGILFRNADALEHARQLTTIIMDKTGTLTQGRPVVTEAHVATGQNEDRLLEVAYGLEKNSEHPLAHAVVDYATGQGIAPATLTDFRAVPGRGVEAHTEGLVARLGSPRFLEEEGISVDTNLVERLEGQGGTVIVVSLGDAFLGCFSLVDQLRPDAASTVAKLRKSGIRVVMLTGDNQRVAEAVARQVGVDDFVAGMLPQNKAEAITKYRDSGAIVGMVGDGINDAPALAAADVSFAIGAGSAIAVDTADVVLMRSELASVPAAISLSHATIRKIRQNLFFAFVYNVCGLPLAAFGMLNPIIAGAAMAMSSVSVVSNSLLLNRWKP